MEYNVRGKTPANVALSMGTCRRDGKADYVGRGGEGSIFAFVQVSPKGIGQFCADSDGLAYSLQMQGHISVQTTETCLIRCKCRSALV